MGMAKPHPLGSAPFLPGTLTQDDELTPDARSERALDVGLAALSSSRAAVLREPTPDESADAVSVVVQQADDWTARWVLAPQGGSLVVRSILIEPAVGTTPAGGVTANVLRALSPAAAAAAGTVEPDSGFEALTRRWAQRRVDEQGLTGPSGRKPGRPALSDDELALVAIAYLEELTHGRGVLRRLAARFDREPATMRDRVRIARREGFLTEAPRQGSRGGAAGPRLLEHLAGHQDTDEEGGLDG